jgi:hypothetical protein
MTDLDPKHVCGSRTFRAQHHANNAPEGMSYRDGLDLFNELP